MMPLVELAETPLANKTNDHGRETSWRILQIAEREVGRIILDIHDGPVQNTFAALSQLSITQRQLERRFGSEAAEDIARIGSSMRLLEHALNDIRTFMGAFRPPEFERRDLLSVLEGLIMQHEESTGSTILLEVTEPLPDVSLPIKIGLYRILQEALSNASRHGHADQHIVSLASDDVTITMEVADNGIGFDIDQVLRDQEGVHIGLEGMRERVSILGGKFDIQSRPGAGTQVRIIVPYRARIC